MKEKYLSFYGSKLKVYWLRGEYCAIDTDVARLYEVDKRYLRFIAARNKTKYSDIDRFKLNINEYNRVFHCKAEKITKSLEVYAFNETGIIALAFDLRKSRLASKISIGVVRKTTALIKLMAYVKKADKYGVELGPQYDKIKKEIDKAPEIIKLLLDF